MSETRLSTPFNKILATPLCQVMIGLKASASGLEYQSKWTLLINTCGWCSLCGCYGMIPPTWFVWVRVAFLPYSLAQLYVGGHVSIISSHI